MKDAGMGISRGRYFANAFCLALAGGYLLACVNGFRMPNLWSLNYFLPSAMEGFYRRSLIGSFIYFIGDARFEYYTIVKIQFIIFIVINFIIIRACFRGGSSFRWIWVLFLIGPAGGYFFHEIGYIDQLLFLILFIACGTSSKFLASSLVVCSIWIHEMAVFTIVPIYISFLIIRGNSWKEIASVAVGSIGSFVFIYIYFQTVEPNVVQLFLAHAQEFVDYPIRRDYYDIFFNEFAGNRQQLYYSKTDLFRITLISPLFFITGYLFSTKGSSAKSKSILFAVGFITSSSPLCLGFFGGDTSRWIFLSLASVTCCLYFARKYLFGYVQNAAIISFIIFMALGQFEYFDAYGPRLRSFSDSLMFIKRFTEVVSTIPSQ